MRIAILATLQGLWRAIRSPRAVLFTWLAALVLGAIVCLPAYALLEAELAPSPQARGLFAAYDGAFVADFLRVRSDALDSVGEAAILAAAAWYLVFLFLQGGALASVADPARRLGATGFFAACGRTFLPFLRGLVPPAVAAFVLARLNVEASRLLTWWLVDVRGGEASAELLGWTLVGKTLLFLLLFVWLVSLPMQLARVRCVVDSESSMLRGYFRGLALCLRRPFSLLLFWLLSTVLLLAIFAGVDAFVRFVPLGAPFHPLARFDLAYDPAIDPLALHAVVFHGAVLLMALLLVQRSAGLVVFWREETVPRRTRDPELVYASDPVVDAPAARRRVGGAR